MSLLTAAGMTMKDTEENIVSVLKILLQYIYIYIYTYNSNYFPF